MSAIAITLAKQEEIIERGLSGFMEVGRALMVIRDQALYREAGFDGFVEYLESKPWGIGANAAYKQIQAAEVAAVCTTVQTERQARELAPLLRKATPEVVQQVYAEVVEETDGKPTAKAIRQKVRAVLHKEPTVEEWLSGPATSRRWNTLNDLVAGLAGLRRDWGDEMPEAVAINEAARRVREYDRVIAFLTARRDEFAEKGKKLLPKETA